VRLLCHGAEIVVAVDIVAPPLRERTRRPSRTENGKRQNEQARQARPIKRACNEVRVILEQTRSVVAEVELRIKSDNGPTEEDTRLRLVVRDVSSELDELWKVDFAERELSNLGDKLMKDYSPIG
jgi:hypothetical protein